MAKRNDEGPGPKLRRLAEGVLGQRFTQFGE